MTWEAHLFFELIHFLLKKPFHQFQFLFNFQHSFLHDSYQVFLVSLKEKKKNCIVIWKSCHEKALVVNFPHKRPRERTSNVCFWIARVDFWWNGSLNTAWVAQVRKVTLSEKESKIKKKNLTCATTFPRDKASLKTNT